jgi:aminotransferase
MTSSGDIMPPSDNDNEPRVKESVIRLMTRLAMQHDAVNLSQGFPNEPPPRKVKLALAQAVLSGKDYGLLQNNHCDITEQELADSIVNLLTKETEEDDNMTDDLNQYSPPMGRADVRKAVSDYYSRLYDYDVSDDNITLTLGATEAVATALRTVGRPGDKVVVFEPFHELYSSQIEIFYLDPVYVTLKPNKEGNGWGYNKDELKDAIKGSKAIILNTPHNPTGKCFEHKELKQIVDLCLQEEDCYIITDEIYEHMTYNDDRKHILIPKAFPEVRDRTLVCNSIGKSASATGWRLGWCLHPPHLSSYYRGVHDQLVAMAPHPQQYASLAYLNLPDNYFRETLSSRYINRITKLAKALNSIGFFVIVPEGSYYLFVDFQGVKELKGRTPMDAAMYLMKEVGVAVVPGDNFYGKSGEGKKYLRFAACRSDTDIDDAIVRLKEKLHPAE